MTDTTSPTCLDATLGHVLTHLAAASPEQALAFLPILADYLEEHAHPLADRVRAATPEQPEWTGATSNRANWPAAEHR